MPEQFDDKENNKKMNNMGDFRITAYSNFAYLADFSEVNKKLYLEKWLLNQVVIMKWSFQNL